MNAVNPVVNGLMRAYGLAAQIKRQAQEQQMFEMRQQEMEEDKALRAEQKADRGFQRRMMVADAGARPVTDDGRVVLPSPGSLMTSDGIGGSRPVELPGMDRAARPGDVVSILGEDGNTRQYEMPTLEERQIRQRGQVLQGIRDQLDFELGKAGGVAEIDFRKQEALRKLDQMDAETMDDLFRGVLRAGQKLTPKMAEVVITGKQLRNDMAKHDDTLAERRADRSSREGIAAAGRTNQLTIAGMREAGADRRHADTNDPIKAEQRDRVADTRAKRQRIATLEREIDRQNLRVKQLGAVPDTWDSGELRAIRENLSRLVAEKNDLYEQLGGKSVDAARQTAAVATAKAQANEYLTKSGFLGTPASAKPPAVVPVPAKAAAKAKPAPDRTWGEWYDDVGHDVQDAVRWPGTAVQSFMDRFRR